MRYRARTSSRDHKIFRRTAINTKKINLNPVSMRGGIRL